MPFKMPKEYPDSKRFVFSKGIFKTETISKPLLYIHTMQQLRALLLFKTWKYKLLKEKQKIVFEPS